MYPLGFDRRGFRGFEHRELQSSLRYLQKWDLQMSHLLGRKDFRPAAAGEPGLLKRSHMRYLCTKCSKEYSFKKDLWKHTKYACGKEKRFKCPYCKYRSVWTSSVYRHVRSVHPTCRMFCVDKATGQPFHRRTSDSFH